MVGNWRLDLVLRSRDSEPTVTNMELFFDLVYVFAVTQLSGTLLDHLTARGTVETLVLFAAVWWAWNYTAWATNWIDPDRLPVRVMMIGLMLLSLIMSAAIPQAWGDRGLTFAIAYTVIQVGRTAFMVLAFRGHVMARNYAQLLVWSAGAGALFIVGGCCHGNARLALWIIALAIDYGGPIAGFALPFAGRTPMHDWSLRPNHLAERCQLIVIIALGESLLATGRGFAVLDHDVPTVAAFIVTFFGSAALWWLYFARHAEDAVSRVEESDDPARLGRGGYGYAHAVMVAGVILTAVGDEIVIAHPAADATTATVLTTYGGTALFLLGMVLFTRSTGGFDRAEQVWAAGAFVALIVLTATGRTMSGLAISIGSTAVLFVLVALAAVHARGRETHTGSLELEE